MDDHARTSWQLIRRAAEGDEGARARFVATYARTIRRALSARWRRGPLVHAVDDAMQDVFVECLKPSGVLQKAEAIDGRRFRSYLASVVRNVARRAEHLVACDRRRRDHDEFDGAGIPAAWTTVTQSIDRGWARSVVAEALLEQRCRARRIGPNAQRRLEILQLRFVEGLGIAEIAALWDLDSAYLHHQYAKARRDFERALHIVLDRRAPSGSEESIRARIAQIADLLRH